MTDFDPRPAIDAARLRARPAADATVAATAAPVSSLATATTTATAPGRLQ